MKSKILIILPFLLFFALATKAQKKIPVPVLPGQTYTVDPKDDTLWVMNNHYFKKTIVAGKQLKICKEQNELYKKQTDTLKEIINQQKILIDTLKSDRDYYKKNWSEAETDLNKLGEMLNKQSSYTKTAIIIGSATTVTAFIIGFILGIK